MMTPESIVLFGGSFDPPHLGHVMLVQQLSRIRPKSKIFVIPAYAPPHKSALGRERERIEMCRLAFAHIKNVSISTLEIDEQIRYTAETVERFSVLYPGLPLELVMGTDAAASICYWYRSEEIVTKSRILAIKRKGILDPEPSENVHMLSFDLPQISSSDIRDRLNKGEAVHTLLSPVIDDYIKEQHLYGYGVKIMSDTNVLVNVDKTVVKIKNIDIKGLNIQQLEEILQDRLKTMTRIIGVTGESIEMDVYGLEEEEILRDEEGLIKAISLADGIKVKDVTQLSQVKKIHEVDYDHIPEISKGCIGERWINT